MPLETAIRLVVVGQELLIAAVFALSGGARAIVLCRLDN
jgi:hypothetical protein